MYGDYSYQIYQLLQQYLPGISSALTTLANFVSETRSFFASALDIMSGFKVYIIGLFLLSLMGYIYGRRNLL